MSAATSPGTGLAYGLQRVCAAWGFARSSFYAMKSRQQATAERPPAKRRGPKPSISDEALLVAIEADLEASPWEGEGHRKVWARLRVCRGIRVSRKRVLRVMRENNLLSPHRCRRRGGNPHVGEIITHAPNLVGHGRRSGVHGGRRLGLDIHRHRALERRVRRLACVQARRPLRRPSADLHGACEAVCLDLRRCGAGAMDHGSQYLSDHFTNQIKFWGIQPSYAFVEQPQTNGVAERFNRTLKEQIIHGRIYRNIAELRNAVRGFVEQYNAQWIVEKNGYLSPAQARRRGTPRCHSGPPHETNLCPPGAYTKQPRTHGCCGNAFRVSSQWQPVTKVNSAVICPTTKYCLALHFRSMSWPTPHDLNGSIAPAPALIFSCPKSATSKRSS